MKACALYARYSTERQSESSIQDQLRLCERIAERNGFTVVARFTDRAVSGGTIERPGYRALLQAARQRQFEIIVAEDTSRLWRLLAEQAPRLAELADLNIEVVTHDLDTRQESAAVLSAVVGSMAEQYRKEIGRRTRRGLEGVARAGKCAGGRSYGYVPQVRSESGKIEIDQAQAEVVRRIFEMYATGMAPRSIAAGLNADAVPSPGSFWNRTLRRKTGWLASAIHGDPQRGSGILNNEAYIGRIVWNRVRWVRSATDSSKRRCVPNPPSEWVVRQEDRLRIVSDDLWQRVKVRQSRMKAAEPTMTVRGTRRKGGGGKPGRYLFTGLLQCAECGASFVLRNRDYYACSSHWHGANCSNTLNVSRKLVQEIILAGIREDLSDPAVIQEVERAVRALVRQQTGRKPNHGKRIGELRGEIDNLTDAIASGMLKSSPALAQRLQAAEAELARLEAAQRVAPASIMVPDVRKRFLGMVGRLEDVLMRDPERGRESLREVLEGERIKLKPDESRSFLVAEYALGIRALLPADTVVAGAGFEPATFGL